MDRKIRRQMPNQPHQPHILHDRRIHPRRNHRLQVALRLRQLIGENQRVDRHIALHPAPMQPGHQLRQIRFREVFGPHSRIEAIEAEINRIGPVFHRRLRTVPIARRSQQLRPPQGPRSCHHILWARGAWNIGLLSVGQRRKHDGG